MRRPTAKRFAIIVAAMLMMTPSAVYAYTSPMIVSDAWTRALAVQDGASVVYLSITDLGDPDTLIGVHTPAAARASLHQSVEDNGVMRMEPVESLPISVDQPLELSPNGYHIMLTAMQMRLTPGMRFPMTLVFQKAGNVDVMVEVRKADYVDPMSEMK